LDDIQVFCRLLEREQLVSAIRALSGGDGLDFGWLSSIAGKALDLFLERRHVHVIGELRSVKRYLGNDSNPPGDDFHWHLTATVRVTYRGPGSLAIDRVMFCLPGGREIPVSDGSNDEVKVLVYDLKRFHIRLSDGEVATFEPRILILKPGAIRGIAVYDSTGKRHFKRVRWDTTNVFEHATSVNTCP